MQRCVGRTRDVSDRAHACLELTGTFFFFCSLVWKTSSTLGFGATSRFIQTRFQLASRQAKTQLSNVFGIHLCQGPHHCNRRANSPYKAMTSRCFPPVSLEVEAVSLYLIFRLKRCPSSRRASLFKAWNLTSMRGTLHTSHTRTLRPTRCVWLTGSDALMILEQSWK